MKNNERPTAVLMLEDKTCFIGQSCGAAGEAVGEICFNTSMIGYPEVISEAAYAGHILTMTYPQIGNYGVARSDLERDKAALRALVVRDLCELPSNFRCDLSLPDYLKEQGIVALEGIDTRKLVCHIREQGPMRAIISTLDSDLASLGAKLQAAPLLDNEELVSRLSTKATWAFDPDEAFAAYADWLAPLPQALHHVVVIDCGVSNSALRHLAKAGCAATVVPWDTSADELLSHQPDGVFVSGGPGNPRVPKATIETVDRLLGRIPVLGLGLGQQLLALAAGGRTEKLKLGHNGSNYPVMDLCSQTVDITVQHHSYSIVFESLGPLIPEQSGGVSAHPPDADLRFWVKKGKAPVVQNDRFGRIRLTHVNINDGSAEGLAFLDIPALSAQFHPTVAPDATGPHALYAAFVKLMDEKAPANPHERSAANA